MISFVVLRESFVFLCGYFFSDFYHKVHKGFSKRSQRNFNFHISFVILREYFVSFVVKFSFDFYHKVHKGFSQKCTKFFYDILYGTP